MVQLKVIALGPKMYWVVLYICIHYW